MSEREKLRWFRVSTETVERRVHKRLVVARTEEEALAEYNLGTGWPSDYDTSTTEVIESQPTKVAEHSDTYTEHLGDPNDPSNYKPRMYFAAGLDDLYPYEQSEEDKRDEAEFLSRSDDFAEDDDAPPVP